MSLEDGSHSFVARSARSATWRARCTGRCALTCKTTARRLAVNGSITGHRGSARVVLDERLLLRRGDGGALLDHLVDQRLGLRRAGGAELLRRDARMAGAAARRDCLLYTSDAAD